jgi:hypothetical protein
MLCRLDARRRNIGLLLLLILLLFRGRGRRQSDIQGRWHDVQILSTIGTESPCPLYNICLADILIHIGTAEN